MPVYFFWGEDDFSLTIEVKQLREKIVDSAWLDFNFVQLAGEDSESNLIALAQVRTSPFGSGGRLVWVKNSTLAQQCSEPLLNELKRVVPAIEANAHLLFTSSKKPDSRLKSTKFLQSVAQFKEFSPLPAWKTEEIAEQVKRFAQTKGVTLTYDAIELLAAAVGNDTRAMWSELEKLALYQISSSSPLDAQTIAPLINSSSQNSLQLATAIIQGKTGQALGLVGDLLNQNEPPLKIVATLVGQFRTWTLIKLQIEAGEKDEAKIAALADLNNPKRLYFLKKEIQAVSAQKLIKSIPLLLELEYGLKRGSEPSGLLATKIIQLCEVLRR
jgi:DNA polymerase-3 subunit delta